MTGSIVWLASYPKSGSVWMRLLIANLITASKYDFNRLDLIWRTPHSRHNFERISLIDSSLLLQDEIDELRPSVTEAMAQEETGNVYFWLHDAYQILANGQPLSGKAPTRIAFYMLRDPRDVAVSFAYHSGVSVDEAITVLNNPKQFLCLQKKRYQPQVHQMIGDWSHHVASWTEQQDVPVILIRYEDLYREPIPILQNVAEWLGIKGSQTALEQAIRHAEFSELQRQEKQYGFSNRPVQSTQPYFRSGKAGAWKEVLTLQQQRLIEQKHHDMMVRYGYLD
ncbi:MAG: sulfotransferase domain-containing protein [Methylobacter sp.]|uniref:sulfotransferase domain-containing protein n=1 Tax=Methylobacter sp. TaxID=2051955 RepID=UPI00272F59A0|nr:sulfotransferase domain-containing protein [Methylobacter sp.]MDP1663588.1 sulfotransferase domain-containing protein [Methylobacter sp.]